MTEPGDEVFTLDMLPDDPIVQEIIRGLDDVYLMKLVMVFIEMASRCMLEVQERFEKRLQ